MPAYCQLCGAEDQQRFLRIPFIEKQGMQSRSLPVPLEESGAIATGTGQKRSIINICVPCAIELQNKLAEMLRFIEAYEQLPVPDNKSDFSKMI